jgi:hypothetical protein
MIINIKGYDVIIDDEDYEKIKGSWAPSRTKRGIVYFHRTVRVRNAKSIHIVLHRLVMGCVPNDGVIIDHINMNTLDNRKSNLRISSKSLNSANRDKPSTNTSGYKGVRNVNQEPNRNLKAPWAARIHYNHKNIHIGYYQTAIEAAKAYDVMAVKLFGEHARLNFPEEACSNA